MILIGVVLLLVCCNFNLLVINGVMNFKILGLIVVVIILVWVIFLVIVLGFLLLLIFLILWILICFWFFVVNLMV